VGSQLSCPPCRNPNSTCFHYIGSACAKQFRTLPDLPEKSKMDVVDVMRQCNAKVPPSRALVKGLAGELNLDDSFWKNLQKR
jgi:hypothetical protein